MKAAVLRLTLLHRLWRLFPARQRRRLAARAAFLLHYRIGKSAPPARRGVAIAGELSRASGLGEGARVMLRALDYLAMPNWAVDIGDLLPGASHEIAVSLCQPPPAGTPLVLHVNPPMLPLVLLRLPRALIRERRLIGYWAWELPVAPTEWRAAARLMHEIWVPSQFTATAIEPLLPGRVRVVPHPLAVAPPMCSAMGRADFGFPADAVVVLVSMSLASSLERKNPFGAIAAFRAAFGDRPDRLLVLKIGYPEHFPTDFERITAAVAGAPNIRIDTRTLSQHDRHALTAASDIVLSLHRSEGFGLVPAEAMLLGKPVIATGWSGNMQFMDATSAALVGYRLVASRDPREVYRDSRWAEPDQEEAVAELRRLADDPSERVALGERGRHRALVRLGAAPLEEALRSIGLFDHGVELEMVPIRR